MDQSFLVLDNHLAVGQTRTERVSKEYNNKQVNNSPYPTRHQYRDSVPPTHNSSHVDGNRCDNSENVGMRYEKLNSSASFRASIRSLLFPSLSKAFLRGMHTTSLAITQSIRIGRASCRE